MEAEKEIREGRTAINSGEFVPQKAAKYDENK